MRGSEEHSAILRKSQYKNERGCDSRGECLPYPRHPPHRRTIHELVSVSDLRADIASEAGARQTYEALINACEDEGTKKTLVYLLTREITHTNMFMKALDSMGKLTDPMFGNIPPDETVKLVFNLSEAEDVRGPWNEPPDFEYIEHPTPHGGLPQHPNNPDDEGHAQKGKGKRKG